MKIFLDSAKLDEIREAQYMGLIDGITTNPTLLSKQTMPMKELLKAICKEVKGPVNAEVLSPNDDMLEEAKQLAGIAPNIVIKIPLTIEGLKTITKLNGLGIKTNATLIFSPIQALLAVKAGANYISPFVGRLDDISHNGMDVINDIQTILTNYGYTSEIIVASIRHPLHILNAATIGADIVTVPFDVLKKLIAHPLTDIGIKKFLDDTKKIVQ